jgi:GNAT superfamily N-acetyltransferase
LTRAGGEPPTPPRSISEEHDLSRFSCGQPALDDWLRLHALNNEGLSSRTYVVCSGHSVVGYYALATGAEQRAAMPRKLRHGAPDPTPVMIIGRLAVDRACQGRKLGASLLQDALRRILSASGIVGCRAVLVHAIDEDVAGFYRKYGFLEFPTGSRRLFLPVETIRATL